MKALPKPAHTNPRGIPEAPFLTNIAEYASTPEEGATLLGQIRELMQKYRFMELSTVRRLRKIEETVPNLKNTKNSIDFLASQEEPFETHYALDDTVFAKAVVPKTKTAWLWLGAGVMLEFELNEAKEMIGKKLSDAEASIAACKEDLEFLKENITTMEVNTARAINHELALRRNSK